MAIELAITDETPAGEAQPVLTEEDALDCFLGTPMEGSYRQYLLAAARSIEAKVLEKAA